MAVSNTQILEKITELSVSAAVTASTVVELKKAVMGNGKPGLLDRVQVIENCHDNDAKSKKEAKEVKEKWSGRTWAVAMVFLTQFVGLVILFIRTGGIK